jgi:hypothetical protein
MGNPQGNFTFNGLFLKLFLNAVGGHKCSNTCFLFNLTYYYIEVCRLWTVRIIWNSSCHVLPL